MNRKYAIQIRHYRTGTWVTVHTVITCDPSGLEKEYEELYGQPVQVIEIPMTMD